MELKLNITDINIFRDRTGSDKLSLKTDVKEPKSLYKIPLTPDGDEYIFIQFRCRRYKARDFLKAIGLENHPNIDEIDINKSASPYNFSHK